MSVCVVCHFALLHIGEDTLFLTNCTHKQICAIACDIVSAKQNNRGFSTVGVYLRGLSQRAVSLPGALHPSGVHGALCVRAGCHG